MDFTILSKKNIEQFDEWLINTRETGGVILIDKEQGWTSFDVCAKLKWTLKIKKIGHAGTLDPLATGLLILCLGRATKTIINYQNLEKTYFAKVKLGATTITDDSEGDEENITSTDHLKKEEISDVIDSFVGEIYQVPPMFSAIKVKGKRLYKEARKGRTVKVEARKVTVYDIAEREINIPTIDFSVKCSKGTYIRTIAKDIGAKLNVGGYLAALRRTAIGEYNVDDALTISDVINLVDKESKQ